MSLLEDLKTIEIKPYTPVYSGMNFQNFLKILKS